MDKPVKVEEVFKKVMEAKKMGKKEFAAYIGVNASTLSSKLGPHWDAHWRVFMKLLPDLAALGIVTVQDLNIRLEGVVLHATKRPGQDARKDAKK